MRAKIHIVESTDDYILIKDMYNLHAPSMTITNDAEAVVEHLFEQQLVGPSTRIFYIDTDCRVDELLHKYSAFDGFKFGYDTLQDFYDNINN